MYSKTERLRIREARKESKTAWHSVIAAIKSERTTRTKVDTGKCLRCGAAWTGTYARGTRQKFCSVACRARNYKAQQPRPPRQCLVCSKSIPYGAGRVSYCSDLCVRRRLTGKKRAKGAFWVKEYFLNNPCVDCGEPDPDVLDFDHRDPAEKEGSVCRIARRSIKRAEAEATKCDVRCANCHRRRHARDRRANAISAK